MSNLTQRLITGTIFVIVLVSCIWFSAWTMALLFLVITVLGLLEFYKLAEKADAQPLRLYGTLVGVLFICSAFLNKAGMHVFTIPTKLLLVPLFLIFFIELFRKKKNPFANIGWTILGLMYIALPMSLLVNTFTPQWLFTDVSAGNVKATIYSPAPVLAFFVLIWVSDSMAYVFGRLFGKHKLWERISPKKTWEGFIGGLLCCVATGWAYGHFVFPQGHWPKSEFIWMTIAFVISVTGMLGDLVESLFKRSIDVKDSGTILPGHGGILDRFDALFLAVPFALVVYWISGASQFTPLP